MMPVRTSAPRAAVLVAVCLLARPLAAQRPAFEAAFGWWFPSGDSSATVFHAGVHQQVWGRLGYALDFVHVADADTVANRTLSGGELSLRWGLDGSGPYALAGVGIGARHHSGGADAFWTVGGGLAARLPGGINLGVEVRYRLEDQRVAGFWDLDSTDLKGVQVQARIAFAIPGRHTPAPSAAPPPAGPADTSGPTPPPSAAGAYDAALAGGASEEAARVTASVVEIALGAMGSPYQWGGTDANGFDCSGLIQYAYGQVGIVLPRTSRDQGRMGAAVDRKPEALRPGDLLTFSADGTSQITHVGLYVGEGQFIHSSSTGVGLSSLTGPDGDSRWWRDRWVGARRIVE